jgi:hypothetical protein
MSLDVTISRVRCIYFDRELGRFNGPIFRHVEMCLAACLMGVHKKLHDAVGDGMAKRY